jgi:arylsulfatase A-like enzyme
MPLPKVPENSEALQTWINKFQNRYKYRDRGIDKNLVRTIKAYYYATISFIDYQVGRIMQTLEEAGQLDNTLVLCTADHGEHLGDYNCFGKRSMHDTASRVPMLVRLPGRFEGGRQITMPTNLVDVAPTFLSVADASISSHEPQGIDLKKIEDGSSDRKVVFSQHEHGGRATYMAVSEEWKYFYSAGDNQEYLFDRVSDPEETRNVADDPSCSDERDRMKKILIDHLRENGETEGIENGDWKGFPVYELPSDPDEGLLIQDHPWADIDIPGYSR